MNDQNRRPKVALVIGSGSVKCAAAIGLRKVLDREGIGVDLLVGCSGGSIYAAATALGFDVKTTETLTSQLWTRDLTRRRDFPSLLTTLAPRLLGWDGSFGMIRDGGVRRALKRAFGDRTFEESVIPLRIVATDAANGEKVILKRGLVRDAIRASIAIPYIWKPWRIEGRDLLDGCLSDPLPVDVAIQEGADIILAMGFESPYPSRVRSATRYGFQVNAIYTNNLLRANFAFHNLAHHAEIVLILPEFEGRVGLFDADRIPEVIEQGERATEAQLPYLRRLMESVVA
jgi:NTE family protein